MSSDGVDRVDAEGPVAFPIVLSAPSGAGKTTVAHAVFERFPGVRFSVSLTTRPRREGERDGDDYRFVDEGAFAEARERGELAEWAVVHGHMYGTPRAEIDRALAEGRHVLLDVDVQGGESLIRAYPDAVSIFLLPPSYPVMESRLRDRGTETPQSIERRLAVALEEIESVEAYTYVIINEDLDRTVDIFASIIVAEEHRRSRSRGLQSWIAAKFPDLRGVDAIGRTGGKS